MTANGRRELFLALRPVYLQADWKEKQKLLDGFVTGTGYNRKHAITLLNSKEKEPKVRTRKPKYGPAVLEALIVLWKAANRICSQRLVPFLPTLIDSLERFGHLHLDADIKDLLKSLCPATMDRLLKNERKKYGKRKSTTRPGYLLKKQIPIQTYSDWNETRPGFFEIDLVAHGGESANGQFLHTLTMTDIASTWTECFALIGKSEAGVLSALNEAQQKLPFAILGIDSDNGSEFINHGLLNWCKKGKVTFTRSREYKKNDQAHVEEKNGSIVRRLVGYDRYEGEDSWQQLQQLYREARLYINFFQPSLKLKSKTREGGKISRHYEKAQSPYERIMRNSAVSDQSKKKLTKQFKNLDPVALLAQIEKLQNQFWTTAKSTRGQKPPCLIAQEATLENSTPTPVAKPTTATITPTTKRLRNQRRDQKSLFNEYPGQKKGRKTNLDAIWPEVCQLLNASPTLCPLEVERQIFNLYPGRFRPTQSSTIREKVLRWRDEHGIKCDSPKGKPGRKTNIDFIWEEALKELEHEPLLSQRGLHARLMAKLPDQVKKGQRTTLASRLKAWRAERHYAANNNTPELIMTIIESNKTLPVVPKESN